ncbi:Ca2+-binding RTX toxin-like protein [Variovorax sp. W2I14]
MQVEKSYLKTKERTVAIIDGTPGNDTLVGTPGADSIHGGAGNDLIDGGAGNDVIFSDAGNDDIWGGQGNDSITGNSTGAVIVHYNDGPAGVSVDLRSGTATDGWGNRDTLSQIYAVAGSDFNDTLTALSTTSSVYLNGGGGDDKITGGWGNDALIGGSGNDTIDGGDGVSGFGNLQHGAVFRLYQAAFARDPDIGGLQSWVGALKNGATLKTIATAFAQSSEFQTTYAGLDNTQFVTRLYQNVLGRAPDAGGLESWLRSLNAGASRAEIMLGFSDSGEFRNSTSRDVDAFMTSKFSSDHQGDVYRLYKATLNREPDGMGFVNWMNLLDTEATTVETVAQGFINSSEFQKTYGSLDNTQFATLLYRNVLNREPDQGGLAGWVDALNRGASRAAVVVGFSRSGEFIANTAPAQANYMANNFGSWSDALNGGAGNNTLIGGRGADVFIFNSSTDASNNQVYGLEGVDQLRFTGFGYGGTADVLSHMTQNGQNVVFTDGNQSITFHHATLAQLSQANIQLTA